MIPLTDRCKDEEIVIDEKTTCEANGKYCHYHTNRFRNAIHDLHCYLMDCPHGVLLNRQLEKENYERQKTHKKAD